MRRRQPRDDVLRGVVRESRNSLSNTSPNLDIFKNFGQNSNGSFERVTLEKQRLIFERGPREEPRTVQRTFTTEPKIKRKRTGHRLVRRISQALVDSFYPETVVAYEAMDKMLFTRFERCDQKTRLAYLGRPARKLRCRIDQDVNYVRTGTRVVKTHTFQRTLPRKVGYVELFGLATLFTDREGKAWFKLHHMKQETLVRHTNVEAPPLTPLSESEQVGEEKGSIDNFSLPLYGVQQAQAKAGEIENRKKKKTILGERNSESESNRSNQKLGQLTSEEELILRASRDPGG